MLILVDAFTRGQQHLAANGPAGGAFSDWVPGFGTGMIVVSLFAALGAVVHLILIRRRDLSQLVDEVGARGADKDDSFHWRFCNIVQEAEAATGIRPIRPVVLPSMSCNSFALQSAEGEAAIGVTEGFLARLNRAELSAVVAHEAAHLVHGDTRLTTTACSLVRAFDSMQCLIASMVEKQPTKARQFAMQEHSFSFVPLQFVLWALSFLGYTVTHLISVAISRQLEFLADAHAVDMCREPLALAESLYTASSRSSRARSYGGIPPRFGSLFLLSPTFSRLDERQSFAARLFSTHPPLTERLRRLLKWARTDLESLKSKDRAAPFQPAKPAKAEAKFLVRNDSEWLGPMPIAEIILLPYFSTLTWVARAGTTDLMRAETVPEFTEHFQAAGDLVGGARACPRCRVGLQKADYEGAPIHACPRCRGALLGAGIIERIIARRNRRFTADEIIRARDWRELQSGGLHELCEFPPTRCPECGGPTHKAFHSYMTRVVVDRCASLDCGAVWYDGGELETIQILVEEQTAQT